MKQRTKKEIAIQIEGLKKMKETLPQYSKFGDNNWEKIDAQLDVLEGKKEPDDFYVDEHGEDFSDGDNDVWSAAIEAENWMNGDMKENLFDD